MAKRGRPPSWQTYEASQASAHHGRHVGGPGQPDYTRGDVEGEVKRYKYPLTKSQVQREVRKGRNELVSRSGFTDDAWRYAERYRCIKLIDDSE